MLTETCRLHRVEIGTRELRCYALAIDALNRWVRRDSLPLIFRGGEPSAGLISACKTRLDSMSRQRDADFSEIGYQAPHPYQEQHEIYLEHVRRFESREFHDDERSHFDERLILGKLKRAETKRTRGLIKSKKTRRKGSQIARDEIRKQLREMQNQYPWYSLTECRTRLAKLRKINGQRPCSLRRIIDLTEEPAGKVARKRP